MERKICPYCEKPSYSSVSYTQVWTCAYCDGEFLGVEGEERGRPLTGADTSGHEDILGDKSDRRQPEREAP